MAFSEAKDVAAMLQSFRDDFEKMLEKSVKESIRKEFQELKLKDRLDKQDNRISAVENQNKEILKLLEEKNEEIQWLKRKNNIILTGIPESQENTEDALLNQFLELCSSKLDLTLFIQDIDVIKRIGIATGRKPRPILIVFSSYYKKMNVLKKSYLLKGTNIYLNHDYDKLSLLKRKQLLKIRYVLKQSNGNLNIKLSRNGLLINGSLKPYSQLIEEYPQVNVQRNTEDKEQERKRRRVITPPDAQVDSPRPRSDSNPSRIDDYFRFHKIHYRG